jgi:hypothetical protein
LDYQNELHQELERHEKAVKDIVAKNKPKSLSECTVEELMDELANRREIVDIKITPDVQGGLWVSKRGEWPPERMELVGDRRVLIY